MTPRPNSTDSLDRATSEALRSLDPAGVVDPQLVSNARAQDTLARILATDPAAANTLPPAPTGWVRGPALRWLVAGMALVGVAALVIVPDLRQGDPASPTVRPTYPTLTGHTEFASWTPTSKAVTPAEAAKAGRDCTAKWVRSGALGPPSGVGGTDSVPLAVHQNAAAVVVDRRGPWTFVLIEGDAEADFEATCMYNQNGSGEPFTGSIEGSAAGAGPSNTVAVPSNTLAAGIRGAGAIDQDTYSWSTGRVGSEVASVVINTVEKGPVKATVHDGHFAAWWPVPSSALTERPSPHSPEPTYTLTLKNGIIKSTIPQAQIEPPRK